METLFFPALFRVRRIQFWHRTDIPALEQATPPPLPRMTKQQQRRKRRFCLPVIHSLAHSRTSASADAHPSLTARTSSVGGVWQRKWKIFESGEHLIMDDARRRRCTTHQARADSVRPSFEYLYQSNPYWIFVLCLIGWLVALFDGRWCYVSRICEISRKGHLMGFFTILFQLEN